MLAVSRIVPLKCLNQTPQKRWPANPLREVDAQKIPNAKFGLKCGTQNVPKPLAILLTSAA